MGHMSREMAVLGEIQDKLLETHAGGRRSDEECLGFLVDAKKRISEPGAISADTLRTQKQREPKSRENQACKTRNKISKDYGATTQDVTHIVRRPEGEETEKGTEEIFATIMTESLPQMRDSLLI